MSAVATSRVEPRGKPVDAAIGPTLRVQGAWFAGGIALGFSIPFVFTSLFNIQHDIYYGLYFALVGCFLYAYVRATHFDVIGFFSRSWRWSLAFGLVSTAFVVMNVLSRDSTPGPTGAYAAFEFTWRGLIYGSVDALLLTAFPGAIAFSMLAGRLEGIGRRASFALLAAALIVVITGAYHLGYQQFREDGIGNPEIGNTAISVPLLLTGNPLGSVLTHATMHGTADVHSYQTNVFLPPQTNAP